MNRTVTAQGNHRCGVGAALTAVAEGLVRKDLREPSNFNILFDLFCGVFIVALCLSPQPVERFPLLACVITALVFVGLCFAWVIYVHLHRR